MNLLKRLSDQELETKIKSLAHEERALQVQVIENLKEIDSRKLHLKRGYGSLHDYCVKELGYSEGSANRRVQAMRAVREFPEIQSKIESGNLNLTNVATVQMFCRKQQVSKEMKLDLLNQIENKSKRECEKILIAVAPETAIPYEKTREIGLNQTEVRFVASQELMEKLEKLKSLLSHSCPDQTFSQLFEVMADQLLKRLEKVTPPAESEKTSATKSVPASTQRWVKRSQYQGCQHRDPKTGRISASRYQLQIDHIIPRALGGSNAPENLQLVCRQHNLLRAHLILGESPHWPKRV